MKKVMIAGMFVLFSISLLTAQDETLFNRGHSAGFFFSPLVEYSNWDKEIRASSGAGLALVVDNMFFGGYALGSFDIDELLDENGDRFTVDLAHSGLWIGGTWPTHKLFHLYGSVKGGWGIVNTSFDEFGIDDSDRVFVVTPDLGVELNVFRWFRIAATVGYRSVSGIKANSSLSPSDLNNITGGLTFRIGHFGRRHHHSHKD